MNQILFSIKPLPTIITIALLLLAPGPTADAGAAVIRVPDHQPTIQAGIDAAADGDTVLVADGTWSGPGNRDLDFRGKAITVRSQHGPDACIIDGGEAGRGFHLQSGEDRRSAIRGFTITNCGVEDDGFYDWEFGGGIRCDGASPLIAGNLILENRGTGIYCDDGADALIVDNTIAGNGPNMGAGIGCNSSSPTISRNRIYENEVTFYGAGHGGGIHCYESSAVIAGNEIYGNLAEGYTVEFPGQGGGIYGNLFDGRIEDNLIHHNEAVGLGGGISLITSTGTVRNNLVHDNVAARDGGGIHIEYRSALLLVENTITGNTVTSRNGYGGGLVFSTGITDHAAPGGPDTYTLTAHNNIITGNTAVDGPQIALISWEPVGIAVLAIRHSDLEGGRDDVLVDNSSILEWGPGMIDADPLFVSGPLGGHYLSQTAAGQPVTSPCVDSGEPSAPEMPWGTTRTDEVQDAGTMDQGFRYPMPPRLVTGPGPGFHNPPEVRVFLPRQDAAPLGSFNAYTPLRYGVNVTCGDVTGDGYDEIITGAGPGPIYGAHVRGFEVTGAPLPGLSFLAYGTNRWGVNVACGDVDGDGYDELVTGAGPGAVFGPHVRIWDYDGSGEVTPWPTGSWFSYATLRWGVNVACGDLDGDGYDEIVTGAGPGAVFGPHVRGWNVDGGPPAPMPGVSFFAYGTRQYGVNVSAGDIDGDGMDEIVTAPGPGVTFDPHIRAFNADGGMVAPVHLGSFFAWEPGQARYGARVYAGADLDGDGLNEIIVGGGPDPDATCPVIVYEFSREMPWVMFSLDAYPGLTAGATVAGGVFPPPA